MCVLQIPFQPHTPDDDCSRPFVRCFRLSTLVFEPVQIMLHEATPSLVHQFQRHLYDSQTKKRNYRRKNTETKFARWNYLAEWNKYSADETIFRCSRNKISCTAFSNNAFAKCAIYRDASLFFLQLIFQRVWKEQHKRRTRQNTICWKCALNHETATKYPINCTFSSS